MSIKINAIAFDLVGVLAKENIFTLSQQEQILERQFGLINNNEEYIKWAMKAIQSTKEEIEIMTRYIVENIYELRDPEIFQYLPPVKLAIASNHLSSIHSWIDKVGIRKYFHYILISADIVVGKPDKRFYEKLCQGLNEKSENILFIDDTIENIEGAIQYRFQTFHFCHPQNLSEEIRKRFIGLQAEY